MSHAEKSDTRAQDRRKRNIPVAIERRKANASEKRRTSERRRQIDPTTCERDYTNDEIEFMKAMDQYKRDNRRPFPTWSEVLEVLRALGYRKTAEPSQMSVAVGVGEAEPGQGGEWACERTLGRFRRAIRWGRREAEA